MRSDVEEPRVASYRFMNGLDNPPHRYGKRWTPSKVFCAVNAGHRVLAAIGARTALDQAMLLYGEKETSDFQRQREELREKGVIGDSEPEMLR